MSELIKRNWGFVLIVVVFLAVAKFFWPEQAQEPLPKLTETPPKAPPIKEESKITSPPEAQPSVIQSSPAEINTVEADSEDENYVEDIEEEDIENRNFILCEHIISGETRYEFTGEIRLINRGFKTINGWQVHWEYEDGSTIVESSDVALSGNNPYTGEYLSWNAEIAPKETITFSFTGMKAGDSAPMGVKVSGPDCM